MHCMLPLSPVVSVLLYSKCICLSIKEMAIADAMQYRGWDQTGSNGANLSFPTVLGIGSTTGADPWIVGIINSAPYLSAAVM